MLVGGAEGRPANLATPIQFPTSNLQRTKPMIPAARRQSKKIHVGDGAVGGDAPVVVQSMCSTDTSDVETTVRQVHELAELGCEIVRVAVPDKAAAPAP